MFIRILSISFLVMMVYSGSSQITLRGRIIDSSSGQPVIGAIIMDQNGAALGVTNDAGEYHLNTDRQLPFIIEIHYTGFKTVQIEINDSRPVHRIHLEEINYVLDEAVVIENPIPGNVYQSAQSISTLGPLDIKQNPSVNFYDGTEMIQGVQTTTGSFGMKIINTRGFNSTSPVRSLQIIDGVDNQAPGLNFSLGNFLGASELDVLRVNIIEGASSAYYGPNAFNGVISMETRNPFLHSGLSAMIKAGEQNLLDASMRFADILHNKKGDAVLGYKLSLYYLRADDWKADNYDPITASRVPSSNPGRYDAVNIYGDEYYQANDFTRDLCESPGLGNFYRTGYKEADLVDYNTRNYKANVAFHFRSRPSIGVDSPECIFASNFGAGTTVYQGDNRFSLRDILFFQQRVEFRKSDKYFIRAYYTQDDAGRSFDPYFTALRLQQFSKSNISWSNDYQGYWREHFPQKMYALGYPHCGTDPEWLTNYADSLANWHHQTEQYANLKNPRNSANTHDFLIPGTTEFSTAFRDITSRLNNQSGGTAFYDKSSLFHAQAEYAWAGPTRSNIRFGGNFRLYSPRSEGTIFSDTSGTRIRNAEVGFYAGIEKKFFKDQLKSSFTMRMDKNENLKWIGTPAAGLVYTFNERNLIRFSYSSALRNPTLADQYLHLNVGPAILAGHVAQVDSLITLKSFEDFRNTLNRDTLVYFNIDPIRPEKVQTWEIGLRTELFRGLYVDVGYYRSRYTDFLGYLIGLTAIIPSGPIPIPGKVQAYRYSANSNNIVKTQGFSIGVNWFVSGHFKLIGNYTFNDLRKTVESDPIIPAYNTPKHKFNLGFSGQDLKIGKAAILQSIGFNINYKWTDGFLFEGSPQFTGYIPSYQIIDAQVNVKAERIKTSFKAGVSNLLNNRHFETYGGPRVGRLAYISVAYNF